ncbi:hypothetical protein BH10BAC6_BH10BAC6_05570 [soil metagenome]
MSADSLKPLLHPDVARLRTQCEELRRQLRLTAEEWHEMSTTRRRELTATYDLHFGSRERELQRTAIEAAEIHRRVELLNTKFARGEKITQEVIDRVNLIVDKEFERFHKRLREAFDMSRAERDRDMAARGDQAADGELTTLYRTLVKKLHPDVNQTTEEQHAAWQRVQDAYQQRNVSQLRSLIAMLEADDASIALDASITNVEELTAIVTTLENRCDVERRKLERLRSEEPFCIAEQLTNNEWLAAHGAELDAGITDKRREISESQEFYRTLTGGTAAPGTNVLKTKDDQTFDSDFMDTTYFGQR